MSTTWGEFAWGASLWGMNSGRTSAVYYTRDDLNRVENAADALQSALNEAGFDLNLSVKTDWEKSDIPSTSDMERYRSNVAAIRAALNVLSTTPAVPSSMNKLTFTGANNIEQILSDVEQLIYDVEHTVDLGWAIGISYTGLYGGLA